MMSSRKIAKKRATSSLASGAGRSPSNKQAGPTMSPSGQEVVPASHSALRGSAAEQMTSDIFGPNGSASSGSEILARSLANRLRPVVDLLGSTLFNLTWKVRATPLGRSIYALRASVRRTSDSGFTSWPTPNAGPQNDTDSRWQKRRAETKERLGNGNGFGMTLGMASWPTPRAEKWGQPDSHGNAPQSASWMTPKTPTGGSHPVGHLHKLEDQAQLTASGPAPSGSLAATGKLGQLNPSFPRWLMGFPDEWDDCAPTVTLSSSRKRQSL